MPERKLTSPISLRGVPIYNGPGGAVFFSGYLQGRMGSQSFYSRDVPAKVHKWYREQLSGAGWKITMESPSTIMCENNEGNGATCSVLTQGTADQGYHSVFILARNPYQ